MTEYNVHKKSKKAFLRWCAKGDTDFQSAITYSVKTLLPILENDGFVWVEKSPDGFKTSPFMIDMERRTAKGIERIVFNFDKYRKYKFGITCTISEPSAPYRRKVISRLVRYKSELDKASWWGASFLSLSKPKAFKKEVDRVSKLLPQILDFLANDAVGSNVWVFDGRE